MLEWNPWWRKKYVWKGVRRDYFDKILKNLENDLIISLIGIRRSGKTQIFFETIDHLINKKNINPRQILFIKIDDLRIKNKLSLELINKFIEEYKEMFELEKKVYLFLDEVQDLKNWQQGLKTLYDLNKGTIKIFITGSNASLLKRDSSDYLTGRKFDLEIYPFSFNEFLKAHEIEIKNKFDIYNNKFKIRKYFNEFFIKGGFPEVVCNNLDKNDYLKELIETIVFKDIILRYDIANSEKMLDMAKYLLTNSANPINFKKSASYLKISKDSFSDYISYFQEVFLFFRIFLYDMSIKRQLINEKKIYAADLGFLSSSAFNFLEKKGMWLENLVFIELKRRNNEIYYHKKKQECDFIIKKDLKIIGAIQVTKELGEEKSQTREREINGLLEALNIYELKEGLILTEDEEMELKINNKLIKVLPIWKWLLIDNS